ncbi:hypothetical protein QN239_25700 [Mycolicibacterium sp. Y3]
MNEKTCAREGCYRKARGVYDTCSTQCTVAHHELQKAEVVCREIPGSASELWAAAVAYSDALTELRRVSGDTYRLAMLDGFPRERWAEIQRGKL